MLACPAMFRVVPLITLVALLGSTANAQSNEGAQGLARPTPSIVTPTTPSPAAPLPTPADVARSLPPVGASESGTILPTQLPPTTQVTADGNVEARLDSLDGHLSSLAARRTSAASGAVVNLLMGGTFIGLGVYAARNGGSDISGYFYLSGGASIASAGVQLGLQPNAQRAYERLQALRVDTTIDTGTRLARAESLLGSMARRRMASRYLQGGIGLGITVGSLPILLGRDGFDTKDTFDWLIAASAAIGLVDAMTTMFQRTEEERRWRMYQSFASRHGGQSILSDASSRLRFGGLTPMPMARGGGAAARFIF